MLVTIRAAADGSALGNPGPSGWAWYVDDDRWAAGGWKHGTNNMGELKAVLELLRATAHVDDDLLVLCDSQYVINSITKWMPGWKRKGWKKGDGKPVLNVDLMKELDEALVGRRVRFEWVKGHAGHDLNEAADVRARGAAEAYQRGTEVPSGPGFPGAAPALPAQQPASAPSHSSASAVPAPTSRANSMIGANPTSGAQPASAPASLFDFDEEAEEEPLVEFPLQLTVEEHTRLLARARAEGVAPHELLRRAI